MNKTSQEIIDKMFTKINEGLAYCKLCDKHLKLVDMIEVEFWRHQIQRSHLDRLIQFYFVQQSKEAINTPVQQNKKIKFEEKKQQQKGIEQLQKIGEQFSKTNNKDISHSSHRQTQVSDTSDFEDLTRKGNHNNSDQLKIQKETLQKSSFSYQCQKYFDLFIKDLFTKGYSIEAFCYILGRLGKATTDICELRFDQIDVEIDKSRKNKILSKSIQKQFQETFIKLRDTLEEENSNYFFKQPKTPKQIRTMLEQVRKFLVTTTQDFEYQKFLYRASIRAFNAVYNSQSGDGEEKNQKKQQPQKVQDVEITIQPQQSESDDERELKRRIQDLVQENNKKNKNIQPSQKLYAKQKQSQQINVPNKRKLRSSSSSLN